MGLVVLLLPVIQDLVSDHAFAMPGRRDGHGPFTRRAISVDNQVGLVRERRGTIRRRLGRHQGR